MGFADPAHSARDDRRFDRTMSLIVTRMVQQDITIPCLKDHRSRAWLALKNISHGMNNNVCRATSPTLPFRRGDERPTSATPSSRPRSLSSRCAQRGRCHHGRPDRRLRRRPRQLEPTPGRPGRRKSLFFATDPVAMDHVGWDSSKPKRALEGWSPVAPHGHDPGGQQLPISPRLAALAARALRRAPPRLARSPAPPRRARRAIDPVNPSTSPWPALLGLGRFPAHEIATGS